MAHTYLNDPLIFDRASDDTSTMGGGHVPGFLVGVVNSAYDQFQTATLTYQYSAGAIDQLKVDKVLMFDAGNRWEKQLFRIVDVVVNWGETKTIEVTANIVAADILGNKLLKDVSLANANPVQLFNDLLANFAEPMPNVQMTSSIADVAIASWALEDGLEINDILIGRDKNKPTFTALFEAEWWFDNYNFQLEKNVGADTGIVIKADKNLLSLQKTDSTQDVYTAVRPFSKYTPGTNEDNGDKSNIKPFVGEGLIQYAGIGGLPMYDSPFKGHKQLSRPLHNGDRYKVFNYVENGGALNHTWYNLGGNQWVDGNYLSFEKNQSGQVDLSLTGNKAIGIGTVKFNLDNADSRSRKEKLSAVLTMQYLGPGKVAVWSSPWMGKHKTGKYLTNGSMYKVTAKANDYQNHTWYEVGKNEWVDEQYVTFDKKQDYIASKARGIGTTKAKKDETIVITHKVKKSKKYPDGLKKIKRKVIGKVPVYNNPGPYREIIRELPNAHAYQIYGVAQKDGTDWYNLGGTQWVDGSYLTFDKATDIKPKAQNDDREESPHVSGVAWLYDKPGDWHKKVKQVHSGEQYRIYGQGSASGQTWYNLGGNQWILGDYLGFDRDTDVEPKGSADDMTEEVAEVTVTLPEKYITVPLPDGRQYEHQRIADFDASEYNITNEDDLRDVTQAYIHDNQVGKPKIGLTFSYAELANEYSNLANVRLYDRLIVYFPDLDLNLEAEVTATTFDVKLQQNTSVTVGTRPEMVSDELAKWRKKADDDAQKAASSTQKQIDDIDLAWQKSIDQVNQDVGNVKRDINAQIQWQQQFKQQIDDNINDYKDYIGKQVADLNKLNSVINYTDSQVIFKLPNGSVVGSIGAGGLYYQDSDGKVKTVVGANGDLIADRITGNLLTGTTIHGAEITGGTIDTLDYFRAKSGSGYTVISADWGLSTDAGIHAKKWSRFDADVLVSGSLTVGQRLNLNSNATSYLRLDPSDGFLYFRGGPGFAHNYRVKLEGV